MKKKSFKEKIDNKFDITKRHSNIKIEIIAGCTTFLAMAYILVVNPNNILWNGTNDPRFSSVFIATAIGAFLGTLLMALIAKMPLAQAPGMGVNAIAGSIIGGALGFSYSYGNAMMIILLAGSIFLLLSVIPCGKDPKTGKMVSLREQIFNAMPKPIISSISVGVGLFITFIGLQNAHIITSNEFTLVELIKFNNPALWAPGGEACMAAVAIFGLIVIGILTHYKVKGSIIIGIIASTILAIFLGVTNLNILTGTTPGISWNFIANIRDFFDITKDSSVFLTIFKDGFIFPEGSLFTSVMLIISFTMIDMFDTMGTVVGCCQNADLLDENGKPLNYKEMLYCDSLATVIGAVLGTSTIDIFVESSTGVSAGGKTGLTAITTSILFLLSIFLLPLFACIPSSAAASALIYVGVIMISNIKNVDFKHIKNALPSFMTIIIMLLSYSITDGIGIGIVFFVILDIIIYLIDILRYKLKKTKNKPQLESNIVTIIIAILFLIYFLVPNII